MRRQIRRVFLPSLLESQRVHSTTLEANQIRVVPLPSMTRGRGNDSSPTHPMPRLGGGALGLDVAGLLALVADLLATGRLLGAVTGEVTVLAAVVALRAVGAVARHVTEPAARVAGLGGAVATAAVVAAAAVAAAEAALGAVAGHVSGLAAL